MANSSRLRVAFQGELGAYAEDAIQMLYGAASEPVAFASHIDALNAVLEGSADRVVLPIENTTVGSVGETHDAIDRSPGIAAVGEAVVNVHYCLMAPRGATVDSIATVLSHTLALAQCQKFFREHPRMQTHGLFDTAAAAREVAQLGDPSFAAVAGRAAAGRYNLDVLLANIADRTDNQTRFLAFARERATLAAGTPARTMIAFTVADTPGALLVALQPFATHGVNLRRIDTRPAGAPWSYRFFVELDHEVGNVHVEGALRAVARVTSGMRVVGTFPRWSPGRRGSIGWTPTDVPVIA
ncbi:MAG TPA: prephenate dehydratase domain-containing protein [Gemmatimonadaceae bacterium]|nr:prephenate dehydratase domain-containing protein [Gemmatimonadaceae bacterium]